MQLKTSPNLSLGLAYTPEDLQLNAKGGQAKERKNKKEFSRKKKSDQNQVHNLKRVRQNC